MVGYYVGYLQEVIKACKEAGVRKLVASTSPSTRFDGNDIDGACEADLLKIPQASYQAMYAESKALGEIAVRKASCDDLMTVRALSLCVPYDCACTVAHGVLTAACCTLLPAVYSVLSNVSL